MDFFISATIYMSGPGLIEWCVKWLNSSIWLIARTLIGITTLGQSGPESNGNQGILHIPQSSRPGASLLDTV